MQATKTILRPAKKSIDLLRERTAKDATFSAVMHRFAIRERARAQVTLQTLRLTMVKEGYSDFTVAQATAVLKFLADTGFGTLVKNASGKVTMLKDITFTLQSIGQAALGQVQKLDKFTPDRTYEEIELPAAPAEAKPLAIMKGEGGYPAVLMVTIDGKVVEFPLPRGIQPAELGFILADIYAGDIKGLTGGKHQ